MKRSVDTLKRRPHIRRAVRHGPVRLAGRLSEGPGYAAVDLIEHETRVIEDAGQGDRGIFCIDDRAAMILIGINTAPKVLDARNPGPRMVVDRQSRRRFLGLNAYATQVALHRVAHWRLGTRLPLSQHLSVGRRSGP